VKETTSCRRAQTVAVNAGGEALHRPEGDPEHRADLGVLQVSQITQRQHFTELLRKGVDGGDHLVVDEPLEDFPIRPGRSPLERGRSRPGLHPGIQVGGRPFAAAASLLGFVQLAAEAL
jgi:hypothetical protein